MLLSVGDRLGPYEILALIGAGGMGEVYRARDTRLDRIVALKVSKAEFSQRFNREARAVAALNHPNICTLYDVGPNYLVMEYVEGKELKGPLPLDKAIELACQILDAVDAAHGKGITHRDLKPANVMVTKSGVKVLDFGLAKIGSSGSIAGDGSTTLTAEGTITGTLHYMAPEQLQGREVDTRSDIFSFGCVLYEMLTGKKAFDGANAASVIAAVMERPAPSVAEVAPPALDRVLKTCLAKDPDERWQSARDVKWNLAWIANAGSEGSRAQPKGLRYKGGWVASGILAMLLAGLAFIHFREKPQKAPLTRFSILLPEKNTLGSDYISAPAISPEGQRVVFSATGDDGTTKLWVRSLDAMASRPLAGTEDGVYPFWSPDGKSIGFFANHKLKRIEAAGGPALSLADAFGPGGGTWNRDGVIVFAPLHEPLMRVSASGGAATPITKPDTAQDMLPWFLPDGKHFLFAAYAIGQPGSATIRVGSLESKEVHTIREADSNAIYAQDPQASASEKGYLLFVRGNTLMAQPFDARHMVLGGEPAAVTEVMGKDSLAGLGLFSASANGTLIYANGVNPLGQLTWLNRSGRRVGTVGAPGRFFTFHSSPDGKAVAVDVTEDPNNTDIWIYDVKRGLRTRFTFDPAEDVGAMWSPDGRTIVFSSNRKGHKDFYRKASNGAGGEELLYADGFDKWATSWSPDGKFLLYYSGSGTGRKTDIWVLPDPLGKSGVAKPYPLLQGSFNKGDAKFSPDGNWIAYDSDETGRFETYATAFPGPGGRRQISTGGGGEPYWGRDGKEIIYSTLDNRLIAVDVTAKDAILEVGEAHALFGLGNDFYIDLSPDGQRFLLAVPAEQSGPQSLTLVQNWTAGLKK